MKNHEGYHDPTAGKAIRRADRFKQKKLRQRKKIENLTYCLGEVPGLKELLKTEVENA